LYQNCDSLPIREVHLGLGNRGFTPEEAVEKEPST